MDYKFIFGVEEETDFLPIIPINEDNEQDKNLVVPDILSLLPLRNTVLFPGVVIPITVGRDKSIKAVNDAYKGTKLIGVLAQKDQNVEDPELKDLCNTGTVAKIVKLIKECGLKVQAQIMDDIVRVTGKKIDDLQAVIAQCNAANLGIPLQFVNMKS